MSRSTRLIRPVVATAGAIAVAAGLALTLVPAAAATTLGALTIDPAKGNEGSVVTATTSGPCPTKATNVLATMYGKGFPASGQNVIGNSAIKIYPRTPSGGIKIPLQYTFGDTARLQTDYKPLSGKYTIVVTCRGVVRPKDMGRFVGTLTFASKASASGRKYTASNPAPDTTPAPTSAATQSPASTATGSASSPTASAGTGTGSSPSSSPSAAAPSSPVTAAGDASTTSSGDSSSPWPALLVGAGVLLALGAAAYLVRARRASGA